MNSGKNLYFRQIGKKEGDRRTSPGVSTSGKEEKMIGDQGDTARMNSLRNTEVDEEKKGVLIVR